MYDDKDLKEMISYLKGKVEDLVLESNQARYDLLVADVKLEMHRSKLQVLLRRSGYEEDKC